MKILISSTYFYPYSSGLSVYALRLAEGLAELGHEVVILTSQYKKDLERLEIHGKFKIVRVPVIAKLSKGVLMPGLFKIAWKWIRWADVVNLHLPQFESIFLAQLAGKFGKTVLVSYHCDLVTSSSGLLDRLAVKITSLLGKKVLENANLIVQNSLDYAEHSPVLSQYLGKVIEVPTPVNVKTVSVEKLDVFREKYDIKRSEKIIGLAGRVASEKGYEYLAMALPGILEIYSEARVIHAGAWQSVIGEQTYQAQVERFIKPFGQKWISLGYLTDDDFETFFAACDVLIFSSLNATESFGIVQIEAMTQGTPVVASDLPGVRQPVLQTGLGKIVPIKDSTAITKAVIEILNKGEKARFVPAEFLEKFQQGSVARHYEELLVLLVNND
ncbi:MAG: glycosyltransferase family 4 protein [Anaerolineaceae bacterium]|jgi:glycosyltransferase involved in cell wall biosynthesis|nr:glycosyltransferase family 4 protein [Anaerolineaceae bacterium]